MGDLSNPGVRDIVDRIVDECGESPTPEELVDASLDVIGPLPVSDDTRRSLIEVAGGGGPIEPDRDRSGKDIRRLTTDLLRGIVSSREYQLV